MDQQWNNFDGESKRFVFHTSASSPSRCPGSLGVRIDLTMSYILSNRYPSAHGNCLKILWKCSRVQFNSVDSPKEGIRFETQNYENRQNCLDSPQLIQIIGIVEKWKTTFLRTNVADIFNQNNFLFVCRECDLLLNSLETAKTEISHLISKTFLATDEDTFTTLWSQIYSENKPKSESSLNRRFYRCVWCLLTSKIKPLTVSKRAVSMRDQLGWPRESV